MDKPEPLKHITNLKTGSDEPVDYYDIFDEWYEGELRRFHCGQFDEKQIAYSAYLAGQESLSARVKELESSQRERAVGFAEWAGMGLWIFVGDGWQRKYSAHSEELEFTGTSELFDKYMEYLNKK